MPDWKRTNFEVLEDRSPVDVPMRWLFARAALESPELGVSRFVYEPGARMPFAHRHREQEETYVVVAGSGRANRDGEVLELELWDVLRGGPAVVRSFARHGLCRCWPSTVSYIPRSQTCRSAEV